MSASEGEPMDGAADDDLGRGSQLACDEALFGLPPSLARELEDAGGNTSLLREQLLIVTSGLALRAVGTRQALPPGLRSIVQAQAFGYFERRGSAPAPTATTTGANVVELAPMIANPQPRSRTWLTALAVAACLAVIVGVSLGSQLGREQTPAGQPSTTSTAWSAIESSLPTVVLEGPLSASRLGARAELVQLGHERRLEFSLSGAATLQLPPTAALWIRVQRGSGVAWQRVAAIEPNAEGKLVMVFASDELERVVGFAVTTPMSADSGVPDLARAQLEANVAQ